MKKLSLVIIVLLVLLVIMSLRFFKKDSFKLSAENVSTSIQSNSNIVAENQIDNSFMIVFLDDESDNLNISDAETLVIPFQELLDKNHLDKLKKSGLKIGLFSKSVSKSAKAFTLLNQLGLNDLYIIQKEGSDNETLLYQFQPDSIISPE